MTGSGGGLLRRARNDGEERVPSPPRGWPPLSPVVIARSLRRGNLPPPRRSAVLARPLKAAGDLRGVDCFAALAMTGKSGVDCFAALAMTGSGAGLPAAGRLSRRHCEESSTRQSTPASSFRGHREAAQAAVAIDPDCFAALAMTGKSGADCFAALAMTGKGG
jgi:hypothetical protein